MRAHLPWFRAAAWRPGAWSAALLGLLLAAWLLMLPAARPPHAATKAPIGVHLLRAEWSADRQHWQDLTLPDDWGARGVARPSTGFYRLRFEWHGEAGGSWMTWSARMPMHHRVWLNGELASDTVDVPDSKQPRTTPLMLPLPSAALRSGSNELLIEEKGGPRSGLGELWLGPLEFVDEPARLHRRLFVDVPRFLNGLAAGAAVFALVLWARRRSEVTLGWFGLLVLIFSIRNIGTIEPGTPAPPGAGVTAFLLMVSINALFGLFAASVSRLAPRHYRKGVAALVLSCVAAVVVVAGDPVGMDRVRSIFYTLLSLHSVYAVTLLWRAAARLPRTLWLPLALPAVVSTAAGIFDQLLYGGQLPQHYEFLMPWVSPAVALGYASLLAGRLVRALADSEQAGQVLEQRVRERTAELESANAAKTRFLAAASHDLRQPMVTIGVLIGLLREQPMPAGQQRLIGRVDEAVAAMEGLLAGLLDLSRLEAGGLRVSRQPVALATLLRGVEAHAREAAIAKGLSLRLRLPEDAVVLGDAVLIDQILRNLVTNAVRYTESGGVLVGVQRRRSGWRVAVWDTGPGIPAEQQARVFEDFVQLDNPQRERSRGLGLGLAIVRRAAALLGTQVLLRSRIGRGSCFSLLLPAAQGLVHAGAVPPEEPGIDLLGLRVALVEDDGGVREALRLRLQAWGAEVVALESLPALDEALAAGQLDGLALLVTDMRLPGGNGLDVVAKLRSHHPGLAAVVVTGNTAPADLELLAGSGLPVVHKPFRAAALCEAIGAAGLNQLRA